MKKDFEFNLAKILEEKTKKLKKAYPKAQEYLLELSKEELQRRLTSSQALKIAETLLEKIEFKDDSR